MFVQVAVNVPQVSGVYDYHLPAELVGRVIPGCLVIVPFGAQKVQGVVLRLVEEAGVPETRPVDTLLDEIPVLTPVQLNLAERLAEITLAPLAACIDLMLPPGLSQQADTLYTLNPTPPAPIQDPQGLQVRLIRLLQERGPLRGRQLEAALPRVNWRPVAAGMVKRGWLTAKPVLPLPGVRPKFIRTAQLACPPEEIENQAATLGRGEAGERRLKILRTLAAEKVPVAVPWVYAASGGNLSDLQRLAELDLIQLGETEIWRDPLENVIPLPAEPPELTAEQSAALAEVLSGLEQAASGKTPLPYLLHGVTGSGKTEIYLRAAAECLRLGKQAVILVPEIALTPQTVRRFLARFPGQVGLLHSQLSEGERYDTWRRARRGDLRIIVGPRSALFAPLPKVGLIVVDECHENSYYQDDFPPAYHAVRAAEEYARLCGAVLLLGSATPPVELIYRARREGWNYLHLPQRVLAHRQVVAAQMQALGRPAPELPASGETASLPLPQIQVVDMRTELKEGNRSIFSHALQEGLRRVLAEDQQAILFLNRRGTSTYVFCRDCGAALNCPRCDIPLTYHAEGGGRLICHRCGYVRQMPKTCPHCRSTAIRQFGLGTERVESEVQALLPGVRTLRWDAETTRQKGAHEIILSHFTNHRADVLVGTQMLAKGLDLPLVTLVGVVLADVGLGLPDFRASERTFQLITQVAGRAGRSPLGGAVVLQTYKPENPAIQLAATGDFEAFYQAELQGREKIGYPPFSRLVRLEYRNDDVQAAEEEATRLAGVIRTWAEEVHMENVGVIGPAPCYFGRVNGLYRWQIVLRGADPAAILRGRRLGEWRVQVDPQDLL